MLDELFGTLIDASLGRIPPPFSERLGSVAIVVEDEPAPEQLTALGVPGLYGLYQGVPRTAGGADHAAVPSKITIFRGPLLRAHGIGPRLERAVDDVVRHEIAHHFGISDERLLELQREAASR